MRFLRKHAWSILFAVFMLAALWMLLGCASTRIDPAVNKAEVTTARTPATKTTRIQIGGSDVVQPVRKETDPSPKRGGTFR